MKQAVTQHIFMNAFAESPYKNNFTYEGLLLLWDYYQKLEEDYPDMEINFDIPLIVTTFCEMTHVELIEQYGHLINLNYGEGDYPYAWMLADYTQYLGKTKSGFLFANF